MRITRFTYDVAGDEFWIEMIQTGSDHKGRPVGFEVWEKGNDNDSWLIDDEPTVITNPIVTSRTICVIREVK